MSKMDVLSLPRTTPGLGLGAFPLSLEHVQECLKPHETDEISTLFVELPHRELGGKITPWEDILKMQQLCKNEKIAFYCDGARIFEATTGNQETLAKLAEPFDSLYISFYKGLGGLSGAMLMGDKEFCREARIWLRRFGGNLYTLLPYAISGWSGYRRYWIDPHKKKAIIGQRKRNDFSRQKGQIGTNSRSPFKEFIIGRGIDF